jgi:predicted RNA binding protein YcfA (HicA-like mRNA interferase family)
MNTRNLTAREVLQLLREDGWDEVAQRGLHLHLEHPDKPGKVTVPMHKGSLPPGTLNSILRQAGLKGRREDDG